MNQPTQRLLQCTLCGFSQAGIPKHPPRCPQHTERALVAQRFLIGGPKDFLLGARLGGKYIITHPLGQGQFGRVYHALQEGAGEILRPVAVKVLREDRSDMQALFLDEMKVIAQLESRHIVRYLDSGFDTQHGLTYMVMELVEGDTFAHHLNDALMLPQDRTLRLIAQLLIALDEAHAEGVIHRDLKPSNLMICYQDGEETLKVLDFGVARPNATQPREQTQGVIPGTPAYMAPELFCGYTGELSTSMDLFSIGVILYQSLMGHLPFHVEGNVDHLIAYYKLYSGKPKPTPLSSNIPKGLADVILKALNLDPSRRYQTAREMLKAIAPWTPLAMQHLGLSEALLQVDYPDEYIVRSSRSNHKIVWLLVAAFLGGSLGLGAHFTQGDVSRLWRVSNEEIEVVKKEHKHHISSDQKAQIP